MDGFTYLKDVTTIRLDRELCTGCGLCAEVCPHAVFAPEGGKMSVVRRDACIECGACALNCPVKAIAVDAGVGCASGMITEWFRSVTGRSGGSGCC